MLLLPSPAWHGHSRGLDSPTLGIVSRTSVVVTAASLLQPTASHWPVQHTCTYIRTHAHTRHTTTLASYDLCSMTNHVEPQQKVLI